MFKWMKGLNKEEVNSEERDVQMDEGIAYTKQKQ